MVLAKRKVPTTGSCSTTVTHQDTSGNSTGQKATQAVVVVLLLLQQPWQPPTPAQLLHGERKLC